MDLSFAVAQATSTRPVTTAPSRAADYETMTAPGYSVETTRMTASERDALRTAHTTPTLDALNMLESELSSVSDLEDYDLDDMLRQYGFESNKD
jgi:hypothetical protein